MSLPPKAVCTNAQLRSFYENARAGTLQRLPAWIHGSVDTYLFETQIATGYRIAIAGKIGGMEFDLDKLDDWYVAQLAMRQDS